MKQSLGCSRWPTSEIRTQSVVLINLCPGRQADITKISVFIKNNFSINTEMNKVASLLKHTGFVLLVAQGNDGVLKCPWWSPCSR